MLTSIALALVLSGAPKSDPKLVGTWLAGTAPFATFNANGTGQMDDGAIKWTADGHTLSVTDDEGTTDRVSYQLSGDSLTVSMGGVPMTLTRAGKGAAGGPKGKLAAKLAKADPAGEAPAAPGTCLAACAHFATCAGQPDAAGPCLVNCQAKNPDPQQLAVYTTLDCQQAIAVVAQQLQQAQGGARRARNTSSQCAGCVRDGNNCVWISQGNWGSGYANPYSGAVSSCDPSCCGL